MEPIELTTLCKYSIICPEKTRNSNCNPQKCEPYKRYEENISEVELSRAVLNEFYREDMRDF